MENSSLIDKLAMWAYRLVVDAYHDDSAPEKCELATLRLEMQLRRTLHQLGLHNGETIESLGAITPEKLLGSASKLRYSRTDIAKATEACCALALSTSTYLLVYRARNPDDSRTNSEVLKAALDPANRTFGANRVLQLLAERIDSDLKWAQVVPTPLAVDARVEQSLGG